MCHHLSPHGIFRKAARLALSAGGTVKSAEAGTLLLAGRWGADSATALLGRYTMGAGDHHTLGFPRAKSQPMCLGYKLFTSAGMKTGC